MEKTEFNLYHEQINTILNTNAVLILLEDKGLITSEEFTKAKERAYDEYKREFPKLFK